MSSSKLNRWEQRILCRKFDCEDNILCRQLIKLILWRKSNCANEFLVGLQEIRSSVTASEAQLSPSVNLPAEMWNTKIWEGVFQKIGSEERAALLLGNKRTSPAIEKYFFSFIHSATDFIGEARRYGTSAAAFASLAAIGLYVGILKSSPSPDHVATPGRLDVYVPPQIIPDVEPVSLGNNGFIANGVNEGVMSINGANSPILSPVSQGIVRGRPIGFDWLRSKGSVSFIEDGQRQLPIVWVSKKNGSLSEGSAVRRKRNPSLVRKHQ